ncbi:MAG TPA: SGNH/GDSL hydrolase family protein [Kiritimatiellae bacterium]|nr:SGNH/GDSL hydrolase family protein [Kiritimatiellia bacterium]
MGPSGGRGGTSFLGVVRCSAAVVGTLLVLLVGAEAGLRMIRLVRPPRAVLDPKFGWRLNEYITRRYSARRADGQPYEVSYHTTRDGFRFWGEPPGGRFSLLVVGDSYTEAYQVSDLRTWYWRLRERLGPEWRLYAYGCGGYGMLQEYLLLREYLEEIDPTLVIWQWCANDLWNDSPFLDSRTIKSFNVYPRPYLTAQGSVALGFPHGGALLAQHSALWLWLLPRAVRKLRLQPSRYDVYDFSLRPIREGFDRLGVIAGMASRFLAHRRVVVFNVGGVPEFNRRLALIARRSGFEWIGGLNEHLQRLREQGVVVDAHPSVGGHWCERGHEEVAEFLYRKLAGRLQGLTAVAPVVND